MAEFTPSFSTISTFEFSANCREFVVVDGSRQSIAFYHNDLNQIYLMNRVLDAVFKNEFFWSDYKIQINFGGHLSLAERDLLRTTDRSTFHE